MVIHQYFKTGGNLQKNESEGDEIENASYRQQATLSVDVRYFQQYYVNCGIIFMNCIHFSFLHSKAPLNTRCSTWHLALDGAGVSYAEGMKKKFMGYIKKTKVVFGKEFKWGYGDM